MAEQQMDTSGMHNQQRQNENQSQKLVVVIADDAGRRHERVSITTADTLLIGRGWHCDLIVEDPLVDAEHARVAADALGELQIEDLDSLNGLRLTGDSLEGGELLLGTSSLRFHRADAAVAPAVQPSRWNAVRSRLGNPLWPVLLFVAVLCLQIYLSNSRTLEAGQFVSSVVGGLVACGVWALFWGVLSKLLRNTMQLAAHFSVICWGLVIGWCITELAQYLGWQAQSLQVGEFIDVVAGALWVFAVGVVTLGIATQLRSRGLLLVAAVPGLMMMFFAYGLPLLQDEQPQWAAPVVSESYPPGWQWGDGDSVASFLDGADRLFDRSAERAAERATELEAASDR